MEKEVIEIYSGPLLSHEFYCGYHTSIGYGPGNDYTAYDYLLHLKRVFGEFTLHIPKDSLFLKEVFRERSHIIRVNGDLTDYLSLQGVTITTERPIAYSGHLQSIEVYVGDR